MPEQFVRKKFLESTHLGTKRDPLLMKARAMALREQAANTTKTPYIDAGK